MSAGRLAGLGATLDLDHGLLAVRTRLHLRTPGTGVRSCEPITIGLAVPRGVCRDGRQVGLSDHAGRLLPVQTRPLERWTDGSVRWLLLDFQSPVDQGTSIDVDLTGPPSDGSEAVHPSPATARAHDGIVTLASGVIALELGPGDRGPFLAVTRGDRTLIDPNGTRLLVRAAGGVEAPLVVHSVTIEEPGPLRASVLVQARLEPLDLNVTCRLEVFAGLPVVRLRVTLHNPRAAQHPGGIWELGDPGSVLLEEVSLAIAPPVSASVERVSCALDRERSMTMVQRPFRVHQESSGRPNWDGAVHRTRTGVAAPRYRGYRVSAGDVMREGACASPIVQVDTSAGSVSVTSRLFWEVFPKAYAVSDTGVLSIDLLPADRVEDHELQGGERFSHEVTLAFDDPLALEWARSPSTPIVDPAWWARAGDVSHLSPASDPTHPYEQLVRAAIEGDDTFEAKRDRIDEYGWRHYGDLYADHENGAGDRPPIVSHYNNQYDGIAGLITQLMRSGDARWWALARDLATHVRYIDIYATDRDKSAYSNGLFWHTYHYVDAGRASHRSYPNAPGVSGGGPSIEHNYSTGLLLHYLMTGDPDSADAVLRLARATVEMDEGARTIFRYLSRGATGLASATGSAEYHGPGRGPANAIHTLLNAVRLTGDRRWLEKAEELIRRCIHPRDDLQARNLLDAERRWYYTVFLQALGRYLAFKTERGEEEEDETWRYARASVLHYARWMVVHEYPYLEKPEILEYPTETWAAQDMRKSEVFDLAAKYAETSDERTRFIERARYFFTQSVETQHRWPTRTWTRPVVLMLSYGYAHLWHQVHRDTLPLLPSNPGVDFGEPPRFESQKTIAIRRAKWLVVSGLVLAAAGILGVFVAAAL